MDPGSCSGRYKEKMLTFFDDGPGQTSSKLHSKRHKNNMEYNPYCCPSIHSNHNVQSNWRQRLHISTVSSLRTSTDVWSCWAHVNRLLIRPCWRMTLSYNSNRLFSIFFLIIIALTSHVSCLGIFELRLDKFVNELNRDASGRCCANISTTNVNTDMETDTTTTTTMSTMSTMSMTTTTTSTIMSSGRLLADHIQQHPCELKCQTFFRVCFKNYQANIDTSSNCLYGERSTPVLSPLPPPTTSPSSSSSDSHFYNYTIQFPFNFTWPGTFSLIIEVWNNATVYVDASAPANRYGQKSLTRSLIVRSFESRREALAVSKEWTHQEKHINQTLLQYSYRILCNDNYYGNSCTIKCTPRNDGYGHYNCGSNGEKICHQGWTNEYCDKPICRSCNETNGSCVSPDRCLCRMGWSGEDCTQCVKYPNCKHGYCNVAMECICKEGWGGLLCDKDLNYCTNNQPCKNGGLCSNTGESFTCQCPPGFAGEYCEKEVDSCDHSPCLNGGSCKSHNISNYTCECPIGYQGRHCEHLLSICSNNPCENEGTCIDGPSGFLCACKLGYSGNKCQIKQKGCTPNPCHGANCIVNNSNESYTCQCRPGFTGDHCEININDCESNPCLNSGSCIDEINSFRCLCPPGFVGEICEVNVDECLMKPCANGATCVDRKNDYVCICPPGFTGKDCSINIDDCASEPCFNGGFCRDRVNGFECMCLPNFYGLRCEFSNLASLLLENSSSPFWAEKKNENNFDVLSSGQLSLIILIASGLTLMVILISIGVIVCKQLKHQGIKMKRRRDEAEARRQNEQNAIMNSRNNKYLDQCLNRSAANVIVNSLDRPASLHQLNKCHKVTNEYVYSGQIFNKCATLQNSFKSVNKDKLTNSEHSVKMCFDDVHTYEQIPQKPCNLLSNNLSSTQQMYQQYSAKQSNLDIYSKLVPQINHKSDYLPVITSNYSGDINNCYNTKIHEPNNSCGNLQKNIQIAATLHRNGSCHTNSIYVIDNPYSQPIYNNNNNNDPKKLQATEV